MADFEFAGLPVGVQDTGKVRVVLVGAAPGRRDQCLAAFGGGKYATRQQAAGKQRAEGRARTVGAMDSR